MLKFEAVPTKFDSLLKLRFFNPTLTAYGINYAYEPWRIADS